VDSTVIKALFVFFFFLSAAAYGTLLVSLNTNCWRTKALVNNKNGGAFLTRSLNKLATSRAITHICGKLAFETRILQYCSPFFEPIAQFRVE